MRYFEGKLRHRAQTIPISAWWDDHHPKSETGCWENDRVDRHRFRALSTSDPEWDVVVGQIGGNEETGAARACDGWGWIRQNPGHDLDSDSRLHRQYFAYGRRSSAGPMIV